eukprot:TRINITY_DN4226_c0_g1_i1.p1 TRINITY_DN4226_c0_g1~~TRINITY_DN4226_c0_g1_i1.p1  ORF type:complete len:219 (-),score=21.56 TRINITY_DN4226_c0_g1_i1:385-1041(-)
MGVKCLAHWQPGAGGGLSTQSYLDIVRVIEELPVTKTSRWSAMCSLHRPITREGANSDFRAARELMGFSGSEFPGSQFFVLRPERTVIESGSVASAIFEKLQAYRQRLSISFEGNQHTMGDFVVKAGRAVLSHTDSLRGIVLELEYVPTCSISRARACLEDFLGVWQEMAREQGWSGRFVAIDPDYSEFGLGDFYSPQHTALQYVLMAAHAMTVTSRT